MKEILEMEYWNNALLKGTIMGTNISEKDLKYK